MVPHAINLDQTVTTVTFKNIPDELYTKLKESAKAHHRSINSELINCLETVLKPRKIDATERLARLRSIRISVDGEALNLEDLQRSIGEGRP
jgi:plasmid stability protein